MFAQNDGSGATQVLELLEMPLDILFEISQYLHPIDILSLGRTSRVTHQLVRSPQFKSVWVYARCQYPDLPDCPGDMTEPAYAELMFGDSCLVCGTTYALDQVRCIFEARDRLCVNCFPSRYTILEDCKLSSLPEKITKLLPMYRHLSPNDGCVRLRTVFYSNFHLSSWLKQYGNAEDQQHWEDTMIHKQEDVNKHAQLCQSFNDQWREEVFQGRKKVFFAHMKQLGYEDELKRSEKIIHKWGWDFRQLCQKLLTPEDMASEIERVMQLVKKNRLETEIEETYSTRLQTLQEAYDAALLRHPPYQPYLRVSDFLSIPRIWSIVSETPLEVHVAKELFNISAETLADITAEATSTIHTSYYSHFSNNCVSIKNQQTDTAGFFIVPEALFEQYASWDPQEPAMKKNTLLYSTARKVFLGFPWGPWGVDCTVTFDRRSHDLRCDMLTICGLDPTTTLLSHLEDEPPVVECTECSTVDSGRLLMSWSWAAYHTSDSHPDSSLVTSQRFQPAVGQDAIQARAAFKQALIDLHVSRRWVVNTCCAYCNHRADMMQEMAAHLLDNHDIPSIRPADFTYAYHPPQHFVRTRYMQEYRIPPSMNVFWRHVQ